MYHFGIHPVYRVFIDFYDILEINKNPASDDNTDRVSIKISNINNKLHN